jgi:hypothetical protein
LSEETTKVTDAADEAPKETARPPKLPSIFRNLVSFAGAAIVMASLAGILFLFLDELLGSHDKPYLGILAYIIFPGIMLFGLAVMFVGALIERRRRHRLKPSEIGAYPVIDLNDPARRRKVLVTLGLTFLFLFVSAFGSYRAYEYTDSVEFCGQLCHTPMNPEFVAYQNSPHARVRCVDCHVGPGAGWYVRSKLSGAYQVYAATFDKFPRPIPTPVHNLRPAQDTCEQCHWPEKFFGAQLKVFNRYSYDEANTLRQTRMLINTGGGSPEKGLVMGIHWHMNIANEITYASSDEQRQVIPWVRLKDRSGNVEEYFAAGVELTPQQIDALPKRRMDCVDCHNRPSHIYHPPDRSVDEAIMAGKLDTSLPFLKRQAVEALSRPYASTDEAVKGIETSINDFYRTQYPSIYAGKRDSVNALVGELHRIFKSNFFPEMKVNWSTHPDNIGHYYSQGCFRCHDGKHATRSGKIIRNDCNICHTTLDQTQGSTPIPVQNGEFRHPVDLGNLDGFNCIGCHKGDRGFQHPVDLGDIRQFKCSDCHK